MSPASARYVNEACDHPTSVDLAWAAGFIEGEGSISQGSGSSNGFRIQASQVDWWPIARLVRLFGGSVYAKDIKKSHGNRWMVAWSIHGDRAAGVAMTLYSLMSPRRQEPIRTNLARWRKARATNRCLKGHDLNDPEIGRIGSDGHRRCRICTRAYEAQRWEAARA